MDLPARVPVAVIGAGLAGLAAASRLGARGIVLERGEQAGGLVRGHRVGDYWFDHVLHLLYFPDTQTEAAVRALVGPDLLPCRPVAWVEAAGKTVRYPLQMNLRDLGPKIALDCIHDLATVTFGAQDRKPRTFEESLLATFGKALCDVFLFPYNRKVWKRPLDAMPPSSLAWTVTRPEFRDVLRGALDEDAQFSAYNATGWYPRPEPGAPLRTMEVLSAALARQVARLCFGAEFLSLDPKARRIAFRHDGAVRHLDYDEACIPTLPLPVLIAGCAALPAALRARAKALACNRVWSVAFCLRGKRPAGRGHWRYYADESLCFNRLIYMHEFDALAAPQDGWSVMAEITERGDHALQSAEQIIASATRDLHRAGAVPDDCSIGAVRAWVSDPAYVVQTPELETLIEEAMAFFARHDVYPVGRYGRWEYSSMGQVVRDGFALGERLAAATPAEQS